MADGNKEWFMIGNARFSLEIDRCLPFQVPPDRTEMQRRYLVGWMRKLITPGLVSRVRALNVKANRAKRNR